MLHRVLSQTGGAYCAPDLGLIPALTSNTADSQGGIAGDTTIKQ